ncbi:MAG: hypothetical protein IKQ61_00405 [Spirochaetales bacterium]|nr:hypothetical protein [Spirochaetales bacterium]
MGPATDGGFFADAGCNSRRSSIDHGRRVHRRPRTDKPTMIHKPRMAESSGDENLELCSSSESVWQ